MINTKTAVIQGYGDNLMLYLKGKDREDVYGQWLSVANWGAVNLSQPDYVTDKVIACWTTKEKLIKYFNDVSESDCGEAKFAEIECENFRSVNTNLQYAEFGTVQAEKNDLDYKDACILKGFERNDNDGRRLGNMYDVPSWQTDK